jgi:pheromone alpha factor receptor
LASANISTLAIFAILEYFPDDTFPEAGSLTLTLVAIFLPLSSVWASAAMDGCDPIAQSSSRPKLNSYMNRFDTSRDRKGSVGPMLSPSTINSSTKGSPENPFKKQGLFGEVNKIELEDIGNMPTPDVGIDRPYNFHGGKSAGGFGRD